MEDREEVEGRVGEYEPDGEPRLAEAPGIACGEETGEKKREMNAFAGSAFVEVAAEVRTIPDEAVVGIAAGVLCERFFGPEKK